MRTFYSWGRVLRLKHGLTASAATWLVAMLCLDQRHMPTAVWMASLAIGISCVSASVFHYGAANRMYTRKGETLSSQYPRRLVIVGTIGFFLSLVIGSLYLPGGAQVILWYNFLAVACYSRWLSRHWATKNLTIALVLTSPILIGWLTVRVWHPMLGYLIAAVFCGYLAREMVKDIGDIKANCGLRVTLPIWIGIPGATRIAVISLSISIALLVLLFPRFNGHPLALVALGLSVLTLASTAHALATRHSPKVAESRIEYGHLWLMASLLLYRFI